MERKQTPTSGLPELLDRFATRVAAAADMPVTLLMGQSPAGLNATGESDIRFFYDRVASIQKLGIQPQLERLVYLMLRSRMGPAKGKEPDRWSVKFNPLWQPSELEQANIRKVVADTDAVNISNALYSSEEAALAHFGGDGFQMGMSIDFNERAAHNAALDKADADAKAEADAAAALGVDGEPVAPAVTADGTSTEIAATAMNGAQVSSLIEVVTDVTTKAISRESGKAILMIAFQVSDKDAEAILGPKDFEPVKPEPPPSPFGGGGFGGKPFGGKPDGGEGEPASGGSPTPKGPPNFRKDGDEK